MSEPKHVEIFTDGACSGNPGPGGWGTIMRWNGHEKELSGGARETTNNRMELTAVIEGLAALSRRCRVELYTDSQYVQKGIDEYLAGWKAKGWPARIKNQDLWKDLDVLLQKHDVTLYWVRGHDGHPENERADALARAAVPRR